MKMAELLPLKVYPLTLINIPLCFKILASKPYQAGPGCSKLTTSLVKDLLNFQKLISQTGQYLLLKKNVRSFCSAKASHIFSTKNFSVFGYKVVKYLMN